MRLNSISSSPVAIRVLPQVRDEAMPSVQRLKILRCAVRHVAVRNMC